MTRLALATDRLATGSVLVARRLAAHAAAWCARGRRDDLPGWRGALGVFVRIAVLAFGMYVLARIVHALPALMWAVSGAWTLASWSSGRPAAEEQKEAPAEAAQAPAGEAVRTLLLTLMGEASGVHLRTVLAHLQERGLWEGKSVTDLRAHLTLLQVPHDARVKVAGVPTWGVRRRDLQAPSPAADPEPSTASSTAA